jgi:hypothetical protein
MEAAAVAVAPELMAAHRVAIRPRIESQDPAPVALAALGVVRFTAPGMSGTTILGASGKLLKRANAGGTSDRDWIAELANQFFGRFKLKLLRGGIGLWSMSPVAATGRLLATGVSQPETTPFAFVGPQGEAIAVWIEIEINGEVKIDTAVGKAEIPHEGDVILF